MICIVIPSDAIRVIAVLENVEVCSSAIVNADFFQKHYYAGAFVYFFLSRLIVSVGLIAAAALSLGNVALYAFSGIVDLRKGLYNGSAWSNIGNTVKLSACGIGQSLASVVLFILAVVAGLVVGKAAVDFFVTVGVDEEETGGGVIEEYFPE